MTVIIDASVALKWVIDEEGSAQARSLFLEETLAAPDLLFIECANVLWTKARRGRLNPDDAIAGLTLIEGAAIRSIPGRPHVGAAQRIAFELDQTAYDSLYLAVAIAERAVFVTADIPFARAALGHPAYARSVRLIGD